MFEGPARITAGWIGASAAPAIESRHAATGALIEAGVGVLALFMILSAWINREPLHLIFGVWLALGTRMAALSAGTDFHALGVAVPEAWLIPMRQAVMSLYFSTTVAMFSRLFKGEIARIGARWVHKVVGVMVALALASAILLPYAAFLPVIWASTLVYTAMMSWVLALALRRGVDRAAAWYAASIAMTLASGVAEVASAALGLATVPTMFNSVTAAIFSALMASIAVAERQRADREEKERAKQDARLAYDGSPIGLFSFGSDGVVRKANPKLRELAGENPVGRSVRDMLDPGACSKLMGLFESGSGGLVELVGKGVECHEGQWFSAPGASFAEASLQEITAEVKAKAALEFMAFHDPLTRCLNLRGAESELQALSDGRSRAALAYIDIDRFKVVNDLYGHAAGDAALKEACARISFHCGPGAAVARIGGDEFLAIFPMERSDSAAEKMEALIHDMDARRFEFQGKSFSLGCSVGVVVAPPSFNPEELISSADAACRAAKKKPAPKLVVAGGDSKFCRQNMEEIEFARCLQAGSLPDGLMIFAQPIMSLTAPFDTLNFEVLLRLRKPDGSIMGAPGLINTAESLGKIAMVDLWVLRTVLEWMDKNKSRLTRTRFASVNLSGASINDQFFVEKAFMLMEAHPAACKLLCLEITETVALADPETAATFISRARSLGARFAIDDFGSGFAGFAYLRDMQADSLKLDGSLVKGIGKNRRTDCIVGSCAALAASLGMTSVGEFAEDGDVIRALADSGVDYAQGYGVAKPMPADQMLVADSSADFIEDSDTLDFLRKIDAARKASKAMQEPAFLH